MNERGRNASLAGVSHMNELLSKLSSYNLFNYLFPGVLFAFLIDATTPYPLVQKDIVVGAFVYYFAGLVVSRVGSLVLEPLLKKLGFLKFADYPKFVAASKLDPKLELLSEANNVYRTLSALLVVVLLVRLYAGLEHALPGLAVWNSYVLLVLLLGMLLLSYRKQTAYVVKRVNTLLDKQ